MKWKRFRNTCIIGLIVCLAVGVMPLASDQINHGGHAEAAATYTLTGDQQADVVGIAKSCQGMKLEQAKKQLKKYGKLWKPNYKGDWCAWYISNCAKVAGVSTKVFPHSTLAGTTEFGKYKAKGKYTPKPGDVALFGKPGSTYHVELVVSVSKKGKVKTVGGNTGGKSWPYSVVSTPQSKGGIYGYVPIKYPAPKANHTFNYGLNGGSGSFSSVVVKDGGALKIPTSKPTKAGYDFQGFYVKRLADQTWYVAGSGWVAEKNLSGKTRKLYQSGTSYTIDSSWTKGSPKSNYTLYAQWKIRQEFTLKFNPNTGTGSVSPKTIKLTGGTIAFDTVNTFKKDGYAMNGWNVQRIALDGTTYWIVPNGSSWQWKKDAPVSERKLYKYADRFTFGTNGIKAGDTIVMWATWEKIPTEQQTIEDEDTADTTVDNDEDISDEDEGSDYDVEELDEDNDSEDCAEDSSDEDANDDEEEDFDDEEDGVVEEEPVYVWSDWSDYSTTPVTASDTREVQTKTEYRYKDKQTTTSGESALSGWTKYDTKTSVSTSGYKFGTPISTSTSMANNRKTVTSAVDKGYYYYAYVVANPSDTSDWCYYADKSQAKVIAHMKKSFSNSATWAEKRLRYFWYISSSDLGATSGKIKKTIPYCADSSVSVGTFSQKATHYYDNAMFRYNQCYKVRTETTTNYFYKWGNWSSWSDTAVNSSGSRQVETRTVYRYRDYEMQ